MKFNSLFIIFFIAIFSITIFSQTSVTITPKKVVYERKDVEEPDFKKTFEVTYPNISGIKNATVKKNLEATLDYWKLFDMTLEESLGDYTWLDSFNYEVKYNQKSLLTIELIMEGSGAYPDGTIKTLVVDLKTGKRINFNNAFTNIGQLLVKIEKKQNEEIKQHLGELRKDSPENADAAKEYLQEKTSNISSLEEFSIDENGVTFIYDYGFPHATQALEPEGRYFFNWVEIKPFIKKDSLLQQFIR